MKLVLSAFPLESPFSISRFLSLFISLFSFCAFAEVGTMMLMMLSEMTCLFGMKQIFAAVKTVRIYNSILNR